MKNSIHFVRILSLAIVLTLALPLTQLNGQTTYNKKVTQFIINGPYTFEKPLQTDSVDAKGRALNSDYLFDYIPKKESTTIFSASEISSDRENYSVGSLIFYINHENYIKGKIDISGMNKYKLFIDGVEIKGKELELTPPHHKAEVQFLVAPNKNEKVNISLESNCEFDVTTSPKHNFNLNDMLYGKRISNGQISPDGEYVIISYNDTDLKGNSRGSRVLKELKSGRVIAEKTSMRWMPKSSAYLVEERDGSNRQLIKIDPKSSEREVIAENLPNGALTISPSEDYIIITSSDQGRKEDPDVYRIITPDDRQPGWRNRSYLSQYDIESGISKRITAGGNSARLIDISKDGKNFIIGVSREQIEKRPHTTVDYLLIDAKTLKADTLFTGEDFLSDLKFSPDGKQLLAKGSPEVFNRVGCTLKEGVTPSMYDMQLYIIDLKTKDITPITKDFAPSIDNYIWNQYDGQIYTTVTEGEYKYLYTIDPKSKKIKKIECGVEVVGSYSISSNSTLLYTGSGATYPTSLYTLNLKSGKRTLYEDCTASIYNNVQMGECNAWSYKNRLGDIIEARFYLPPQFDSGKKYPMIVNYYGGCTPTTRGLETRYPQEYYASLGYVVLVIQPSGAIGFGQEFSSRHVGTWGKGVAEDIIEGVEQFCKEHPFVNSSKIGCIGASYGGFMTMYLQTVTDIFACAVSHAGISNIASYWGEGYWGYSYGHVASGENYPWNAKEMYVNQSPLFNADKINTPLLLLHGSADTNVPHIESIQMFTALKILGKECAFVEVNGENHWILEYSKRIKWSNTAMAWFQKYLKEDSLWWDSMYPNK